jgi:hypothetical protein
MLYFLKLSISLSVVYLFYQVLLRRLTFYNWNRWYLLVYSAICFFIPLVDVFGLLQKQGLQNAAVINYVPAITGLAAAETTGALTGLSSTSIYVIIFTAGCLLLFTRLLIQFISLKRLKTSAVLLTDGGVKIYHIDKKIIPFSAGNSIYVNRHLHAEHELKEIIRHEFIHVKQRHSLDLWWGEILCILNWYNPFAWLLRNAMRQNLEFIADHQVLQSGLDVKQYQYLLLKVTGNYSFSIASNFNFSSLKKRIVMMNKNKSANRHLVRFLFMLPLLAVVLLAFREVAARGNYHIAGSITDTVPAAKSSQQVEELMKQKGIKNIRIKEKNGDHKATVEFTNGTKKVYDLNKSDEKEAFEDAYGDLAPPPPVPAVPAVAPKPPRTATPSAPSAPATPARPSISAPTPPSPPTPPVKDEVVEVRATATGNFQAVPVGITATGSSTASGTSSGTTVMHADLIEIRPVGVATGGAAGEVEETRNILEIKNTITREELERLVQELREKGYALTLNKVSFNDGKLVTLEGVISSGQTKGSFSADNFKMLTVNVSTSHPDQFYIRIHSGSVRV